MKLHKVYDYVFVLLVYKNATDLKDFFLHFDIPNSKVIVVNSYYNDANEREFKDIAEKYSADFLSVPNKGYGAGNNRGCEYALANYDFKYLVISNPDVAIRYYLPAERLPQRAIIAPIIKTLKGKNQNPYSVYCNKWVDMIKYQLLKVNSWKLVMLYYIFIRLSREIYLFYTKIFSKKQRRIAAAHGSHLLIAKDALNILMPLYNERMFLFCEEEHLAQLAKASRIPIYYVKDIKITHKEDGSINTTDINANKMLKESFFEYYNHWYKE
jgi:GT2 family glycosyltransferase